MLCYVTFLPASPLASTEETKHNTSNEDILWNTTFFSSPPQLPKAGPGGLHVLLLFVIFKIYFSIIFSESCQTNHLKIYPIDLRQKFAGLIEQWLLMIRLKLVFDPSRDVAMTTNFSWLYSRY